MIQSTLPGADRPHRHRRQRHQLYQYALSDPTNYTDPIGEHSTGEEIAETYIGIVDLGTGGATHAVRNVLGIGSPQTPQAHTNSAATSA